MASATATADHPILANIVQLTESQQPEQFVRHLKDSNRWMGFEGNVSLRAADFAIGDNMAFGPEGSRQRIIAENIRLCQSSAKVKRTISEGNFGTEIPHDLPVFFAGTHLLNVSGVRQGLHELQDVIVRVQADGVFVNFSRHTKVVPTNVPALT